MTPTQRKAAEQALEAYSLRDYDMGKYMEALRAALAEQPAEQEPVAQRWQPIETAPKGRIVLVYYKNSLGNGRTMRARYYLPETLDSDTTESGWADEGWYEESEAYEYLMPLEHDPTHWMPLPAGPDTAPQPKPAEQSAKHGEPFKPDWVNYRQGLADGWEEGYEQGVADERTSEANIGIAGFSAKVNPARENPYKNTAPQPAKRVQLTDEEIDALWAKQQTKPFKTHAEDRMAFASAVIAAYDAKNSITGETK